MKNPTQKLEDVADLYSGYHEKGLGDDDPSGTHLLVSIRSISPALGHPLIREECNRFTPSKDPGGALLCPHDLVLPARGNRHDVAYIHNAPDKQPLVASSIFHVIRTATADLIPSYLHWWLNAPETQALLVDMTKGSNIPFLAMKSTREIPVPIPPIETQVRIAELNTLTIREAELSAELRDLRYQLTQSIAQKIATGALSA